MIVLSRIGGLTPCLPACLVSVVRPPFILLYMQKEKQFISLFWGTLQGTASTTPPINGNAKGVVSVDIKTVSVDILPNSLPPHISAPSCRRPSAKRRRLGGLRRTKPRSRRTLLDAGRGRVLESMS